VIYEWRPNDEYRNYGDALGEIVIEALVDGLGSGEELFNSPRVMYFPIGSTIDHYFLDEALLQELTPIFISCGWRGEEIAPETAQQAMYLGCRGPGTQGALERAGVSNIPVHGDTAYIAFDFLQLAPQKNGKTLLIPHINSEECAVGETGADEVLLPRVVTRQDIVDMASYIGGSDLVLSGAMHACITAHAFGVPFGIHNPEKNKQGGIHEKWYDWLESIGVAREDVQLSSSVEEAKEWHSKVFYTA